MATSGTVTNLFSGVSAIQHSEILLARSPVPPFESDDQARLAQQSDALGEIGGALFAADPDAMDQTRVDNASNHVQIVQVMLKTMQEGPDDHSVTVALFFAGIEAALQSLAFV